MRVLVTGAAGFIGYHLSAFFAARGITIIGVDNLNDYYDPALKKARLVQLSSYPSFSFEQLDFSDAPALTALFAANAFTHVVHLGAQAGVRYSLINPASYVQSNLVGFANILECCRHYPVAHLVYASSSSVYGLNATIPYSADHAVNHPVSLYAATKISNEKMAHAYSHLYNIPTTGLRFFTVYGPWGRPDMAPFIFTTAILRGEAIPVFNQGHMLRDFTYIDDIVESTARITSLPAKPDAAWDAASPRPSTSSAPYAIYNIGNSSPVPLMDFIRELETQIGKSALINYLPMQPGDVTATYADCVPLEQATGFAPATSLSGGVERFISWFREYYA